MNEKTIEERVAALDDDMNSLRKLPKQVRGLGVQVRRLTVRVSGLDSRLGVVESQIVQLRVDMTDEFSAVRKEMGEMKHELQEDIASLGRETAAGFLRAGVEMRALFEEYLGRRAVIAEGNPTPEA